MKKTLLIGGGGHARSVAESADAGRFAGYVAPEPATEPLPLPYEGDDDFITGTFSPEDFNVHIAVGFGKGCSLTTRRAIIGRYQNYEAATVIAPSAIVTPASEIGEGCAIMARSVVNRSRLGNHCIVNTGAVIEHDCRISDNVFIGPGAIICGEVNIESDVFIGAGAIIRQGLTIASGAVIAMGAVVTHDITEPGTYMGVPARLTRKADIND